MGDVSNSERSGQTLLSYMIDSTANCGEPTEDPVKRNRELAIEQALQLLGEHFDAVQILVTFNEEAVSKFRHTGAGNWYARQGMAQEFIRSSQDQSLAHELSNALRDDSES